MPHQSEFVCLSVKYQNLCCDTKKYMILELEAQDKQNEKVK